MITESEKIRLIEIADEIDIGCIMAESSFPRIPDEHKEYAAQSVKAARDTATFLRGIAAKWRPE